MSDLEAPPETEQLIATGGSVQADQSSESESSKQKTVTLTLTIDDIARDSNQVSLDVRKYTVSGQMAVSRKNCNEERSTADQASQTDLTPKDISVEDDKFASQSSGLEQQQVYGPKSQTLFDLINNTNATLNEASSILLKRVQCLEKLKAELDGSSGSDSRCEDLQTRVDWEIKRAADEITSMLNKFNPDTTTVTSSGDDNQKPPSDEENADGWDEPSEDPARDDISQEPTGPQDDPSRGNEDLTKSRLNDLSKQQSVHENLDKTTNTEIDNVLDISQVFPLATSDQVGQEESVEANPQDIAAVGERENLPSVEDSNLESGEQQGDETEPEVAETTHTDIEHPTDSTQVLPLSTSSQQEESVEPNPNDIVAVGESGTLPSVEDLNLEGGEQHSENTEPQLTETANTDIEHPTDSTQVLPLSTSSQVEQEKSAEANPQDIAAVGESGTLPSGQDTNLESGEQQSERTELQVAETTDTEIGNVTDGSQAVPHTALPQEEQTEPTESVPEEISASQTNVTLPLTTESEDGELANENSSHDNVVVSAEQDDPERDDSSRRSKSPSDATPIAHPDIPLPAAKDSAGESHAEEEDPDKDASLDEEVDIDLEHPVSPDVCPLPVYDAPRCKGAADGEEEEVVTPVPVEDVTPTQKGIVALVQAEGVAPVQTENVAPVQVEDVAPMQGDGVAPMEAEEIAPVQAEDVTPVQAAGVAPMQGDGVTPVQAEGEATVQAEDVTPMQAGDVAPMQDGIVVPVQVGDVAPVQERDVALMQAEEAPVQAGDMAPMQGDGVAPVRAEGEVPVQAEDVTPVQAGDMDLMQDGIVAPVQEGDVAPVQTEEVAPVQAEDVTPVQAAGVAPMQGDGVTPVQAEGEAPVQAGRVTPMQPEKVAPVQAEDVAPVHAGSATPVQEDGVAPMQAGDMVPMQVEIVAPVQAEGETQVQAEGEAPVQAGDATPVQVGDVVPVQEGDVAPMQGDGVAPMQAEDVIPAQAGDATPVEAGSVTPVQAGRVTPMHVVVPRAKQVKRKDLKERKKMEKQEKKELEKEEERKRKLDQQKDKNQRKYRKFYWNFILTTYFTTLNDIESNKVDIETVEFHEMLVEIHEFDKSAAWAKYERWTVPTLIKKLLGPMTTWEELNDTQHQFCRALNSLHEQEIYKNSAKKVLAYLHNLLNISSEPRMLYRLSNEFESDVWDWMLCNYQTNVEKYVTAQEEIRGRLSPNLDYATFPAFVDRLQFYSKCKNKDADSAFLYECYAFFEEHVHIQREVLSDDFQKMFTQPEDSLKDVEMEYFQRVLGLVNKMIVF